MDVQTNRYKKIQPDRPEVNEELIGAQIDQLWEFNELDGNKVNLWCKGKVVAINKGKNCTLNGKRMLYMKVIQKYHKKR